MTIHGAKKGGGKPRQPIIAPDSAQSKTYINILYGLGEGEIAGLVNGYKSVYLDDTPLQNDHGEFNFPNVKVDFRAGTNDQTHIDGFPDVASETNIGVELKHGTPWVKSFNNLDLDAVRVRLKWGALRSQNAESGDVSGVRIDYAIDVKTDNGGWVQALATSINAKTSDAYERSHRIDLPPAQTGWQVRVRRITPNSTSDFVSDKMYISAITEVIDLKLRYPNTAVMGLCYDAESFSNVAKMSARCKGLIIKVPTNYDPVARTYTGMWDGQFKLAYSNNPAWVYYDLCTNTRYGLGNRLTPAMIDKWSLYRLAQYCDEMVDDGMGGQEPRFTVNVYIQSADGAFELLSKLAGVFRAISYWDGNSIVVDADIPQDSIYSFSRANVIDGVFEYTGTRARDRHTVAKVAWDNPANHFKTEYEYVRDEAAIAKFGVRVADIAAWGCTSRGQAQRAGLWALKSEQLETRMVTFKVGLDGYIPAPAKVIEISDELFAGRATGGRVLAVNKAKTVITLDRTITAKAGDTLVINGDDGTSQRRQIRSVSGDKITVTKAFGDISVENVWVLDSADLATMKFRVLSVTADDNHTFTITAVQYNPAKYDAIDHGAYIDERPISIINPTVQAPTKSVNLSSYHTVNQGVSITTLVIGWEQVTGAVKYQVEWRKDNGNWQTLPPTGTNSIEITGVYAGQYEAKVTAISAFGEASLATHSNLTEIQGKVGKPNRLSFIRVTGVLFGMNLAWGFVAGSDDTNYTEIQVSPDGRSNITTLGTFAYPTNKHEITGLQGNLTQFYRGRIVDKLGNTSDWTAWTSGTTSADADKVLNLIGGQISQSHLDQSLRTPIGKIGTLETAVSAVNGSLSTLNSQLANTRNELATAKSTLQTAVGNITAERNRISGAIRDIGALQSANTAKTQEIANLTQTLNGHASRIQDLVVTTGDLLQKYTSLKTVSDTANSEITAIKQTQNGQATTINRLSSEMNGKASTANLETLRQSMISGDNALSQRIDNLQSDYDGNKANISNQIKALSDKDTATASQINQLTANFGTIDGRTKWTELRARTDLNTLTETGKYFIHAGSNLNAPFAQYAYVVVEKANANRITQTAWADNNANLIYTRVYNGAWQAWEKTATGSELAAKASTADLTAEQQARADADGALGQRISAIDTAYKQADIATNAKLANAEKAISDNNTALSQRISALDSAYKKSDTDITARLAREETARATGDTANSQAIRTLESTVQGVSGRVGTSESKIASLERTTSDTNQALATAQNQLNARFDNLAVGGRNLLLATGKMTDTRLWQFSKHANQTQTELPRTDSTLTLKSNNQAWVQYYQRSDRNAVLADELVGGQTYTLSFEARASTTTAGYIRTFLRQYFTGGSNNTAKNFTISQIDVWQKFSHTFTLQDKHANHLYWQLIIEINSAVAGQFAFKKVKLEKGNIATDWTPAPEDANVDLSPYTTTASLDEFRQAQATKDTATAQKLSQLESGLGVKANATTLDSLTTKVNQVDGKLTAETQKISTLQTTVNGQTASIQQHAQSLNGLSAQWTLKVQSGNIVSGIVSASNNGVSDFAVRADKFYIAPPTGTTKNPLFSVITTPTTLNGVAVPVGNYLSDAFIQNGTITNAKIANGAITSAKIGHAQINTAHITNGAIDSAKIRDGSITTAKIGHAQIDTLQIADGAVIVPRARFLENAGTITLGQRNVLMELSIEAIAGMAVVINARLKPTAIIVQRNGIWRSNSPQYALIAILSKNGQEIKRDNLVNNNDGSILGDFILFGYVDVAHNGVNTYKLELHFAHHWDNAYRDTSATIADASLSLMLVKK